MTIGGGVDAAITRNFAVRVAQLDYLPTRFSLGLEDRQNNLRFSTGVVFRFGY